MKKGTFQTFIDEVVDNNLDVDNYTILVTQTKTEVTYGVQDDINLEYCKNNNIPVYNLFRDGGCIVHSKNSVSWADIRPNNKKEFRLPNIKFLNALVIYLKDKELNVVQEGNDILVDGYKVASGCAINLKPDWKRTFSAVQISIDQDLEAIKNICTKPMKKEPKGLREYGITTEEIEEFVIKFFKDDNL